MRKLFILNFHDIGKTAVCCGFCGRRGSSAFTRAMAEAVGLMTG
jgi:hypothetical protein